MLVAGVQSGVYQLLLIAHILSVVVAFAPAVAHPLLGARLQREDQAAARRFFAASSTNGRTVHLPALGLAGLLGFALVGISESAFAFGDPWVSASALLWVIASGVAGAVIVPAERGMATGEAGAESRLRAGGAVVTVILVVLVFLMVVKPG